MLRNAGFVIGICTGVLVATSITLTVIIFNSDIESTPHENGKTKIPPIPTPKTVLVAVMTAEKYLATRASASYNTWGKLTSTKYFCHLNQTKATKLDIPEASIVNLEDVDDTAYPPQKKAIRMLQYLCQNHINDYAWFVRADDDVYIKVDKLTKLLKSLDYTQKMYMGQPGFGKKWETGSLNLGIHSYCMGGPSIILSQPALRALCPHLESCLQQHHLKSTHEDVELGRCIFTNIGIDCTQASELSLLFFHAYAKNYEGVPFLGDLSTDLHVRNAITIHFAKQPFAMYNLHFHYLAELIEAERNFIRVQQEQLDLIKELCHQQKIIIC